MLEWLLKKLKHFTLAKKKVLFVNYHLFIGGAEKLLIELTHFCLENNIQPEILVPDNFKPRDNRKLEYYDEYLKKLGIKVYRVPVFHETFNDILPLLYWKFRMKYSSLFYSSVHIFNLNLCDRLQNLIYNKNRYFWHIVNSIQFPGKKYHYSQSLVSNPNDNLIIINKYQLEELKEHFKSIACKILNFKLFLYK